MVETDILIVGGGPAGAQTARYLADANIDNILLQRNFGFRKPCGGGIRKDAFSEFELDENEINKTVTEIGIVHKEKVIDIDISDMGIAIVDRMSFDHSLRKDAQEKGTKLYEAAFVSIETYDTHVVTKIKMDDEYKYIKSNYVVGADGVNSKVRKLVNGDAVSAGMTYYCDIESKHYKKCSFHLGADVSQGFYAWAFPHLHGSNIGTDSIERLETLKKDLNINEDVKTFGYKIPVYKNPVFYKERVFFVGDSAS